MNLGLIARADDGGIGVQTQEIARHVQPEKVLVVDVGAHSRGTTRHERYAGFDTIIADRTLDSAATRPFLDGLDAVLTIEGAYRVGFGDTCAARGVRLVVQANPELYRPADLGRHAVVLPTHWELGRFPAGTPILPVPVNRDRLPPKPNDGRPCSTFLHVAAPAMLDRNGTELLLAAVPFVQHPIRLVVHIPAGVPTPIAIRGGDTRLGNVDIEVRSGVEDYWQTWSDDIDAFVLPRRYGGLSLTMQEAFSRALPVVTLDLDPQRGWEGTTLVPVRSPRPTPMKGGTFDVWTCDPHDLAIAIDHLAIDGEYARSLSERADRQGDSLDWTRWADRYRTEIEALC